MPEAPRGRAVRSTSQTLGWGALWGAAYGFSALAPRVVRFYRIAPEGVGEWLHLLAALLVTFVALGALLGFIGGLPIALWHGLRRGRMRNPALAYGLCAGVALPIAYLLAALGIESASPSLPAMVDSLGQRFVAAAALAAVAAAALVRLYARIPAASRATRGLAAGLVAVSLAGAAAVPLRVPALRAAERGASRETAAKLRRSPANPLLVVGIDGGNWTTLSPLLSRRGAADVPNLGRLVASGIHGSVDAIWPPFWSAPAWAAILTGYPRAETGVYEELTGHVPGVPPFQVPLTFDFVLEPVSAFAFAMAQTGIAALTQPPRAALHRPPFWELLGESGVATAVVRFRFTYPASGPAAYVISDWVGDDQWSLLGLAPTSAPEGVWPRAEAEALLEPFSHPVVAGDFAPLLAAPRRPPARDAALDPVSLLEVALRIDQQTLAAAESLLRRDPEIAVLAVYLGGFDTICHAFWQYRFPAEFPEAPPDRADVEALGGVIDRYWAFLDRSIGALTAAFPRDPNVVVVADHGIEPIHRHSLWRGWHAAAGGIFIAAGPDVAPRTDERRVAYVDVVPTILELAGVEAPRELPGASLLR